MRVELIIDDWDSLLESAQEARGYEVESIGLDRMNVSNPGAIAVGHRICFEAILNAGTGTITLSGKIAEIAHVARGEGVSYVADALYLRLADIFPCDHDNPFRKLA